MITLTINIKDPDPRAILGSSIEIKANGDNVSEAEDNMMQLIAKTISLVLHMHPDVNAMTEEWGDKP